jgi:rhodanese-related sulfurtransferase
VSSISTISADKLARLIGTPRAPAIIDLRSNEEFAADPRLIPGAVRMPDAAVERLSGPAMVHVVVCRDGSAASHGAAARLRSAGHAADVLAGGFEAWRAAALPLLRADRIPPRSAEGHTVWVTRERPKIDRIACPWLVRRFVDPAAQFLFVAPAQVVPVAERFGAAPFDIEGVFWTHRGDRCTFDTMIEEFGLTTEPLLRLATIVRGSDTARPELAPEAPGLLAVSLGLSRMYADDLEQLDAGMLIYDALYRWCRDATDETHNWPSSRKAGS